MGSDTPALEGPARLIQVVPYPFPYSVGHVERGEKKVLSRATCSSSHAIFSSPVPGYMRMPAFMETTAGANSSMNSTLRLTASRFSPGPPRSRKPEYFCRAREGRHYSDLLKRNPFSRFLSTGSTPDSLPRLMKTQPALRMRLNSSSSP